MEGDVPPLPDPVHVEDFLFGPENARGTGIRTNRRGAPVRTRSRPVSTSSTSARPDAAALRRQMLRATAPV